MGPFSTKQKSCFFCETMFHAQTEQKTAESKCPIFTLHHTVYTYPHSYPHTRSNNRRYFPHIDDTFPNKSNKPKNTLKSPIPTFPSLLIITLISKKKAHFALFSYILSYYVLYLLVPKLLSIVFHIFLFTNESFKPYDF